MARRKTLRSKINVLRNKKLCTKLEIIKNYSLIHVNICKAQSIVKLNYEAENILLVTELYHWKIWPNIFFETSKLNLVSQTYKKHSCSLTNENFFRPKTKPGQNTIKIQLK